MSKQDLSLSFDQLESMIKGLIAHIDKAKVQFIDNKEIQNEARQISQKWFEELDPSLDLFSIAADIKESYHKLFTELLKLAMKKMRSSTYLNLLGKIQSNLRQDILVPILKSHGQIFVAVHLPKILEKVTAEEKKYLMDALRCASIGCYKASVVVAWCAAIDRMHRVVEKLGFAEFNKKAEETRKAGGKFKPFDRIYNVHSLSDLRSTVFDNDLLYVLEFWQLIDVNQHQRLSNCFTMRCNSAHPGEATISPENLASFYSDLKSIVFDNPKFKV